MRTTHFTHYSPRAPSRLPPTELALLREVLRERGLRLRNENRGLEELARLRAMYEPYVDALARSLLISLPAWVSSQEKTDNWQVAPWDDAIAARTERHLSSQDHF